MHFNKQITNIARVRENGLDSVRFLAPAPKSRQKQFIREQRNKSRQRELTLSSFPFLQGAHLWGSWGVLLLQSSNSLEIDRRETIIRPLLIWGKCLLLQRANKSNTGLAHLNYHDS